MGSFSIWHWILVLAVVLLLFGSGKISGLMGEFAQGIKAFKKGMKEDNHEGEGSAGGKTIEGQASMKAKDKEPVA